MWVFMRHDVKEYNNGKGVPRFDSPLAEDEFSVHRKILGKFNPETIICSPFRRCRETSKRYYPEIIPIIDTNLSEYLGHWKSIKQEDFDPETWEYIKNFEFETSIEDLFTRLRKFEFYGSSDTLVISHGLCLEILWEIFDDLGYNPKFISSNAKLGFKIDTK